MTGTPREPLTFHGGLAGALVPFACFLAGVGALAMAGAPDERGLWPVLLAALAIGFAFARDRRRYADAVVAGMSRPIVMLMVMAWLLAGVLGALMNESGFVESMVWVAGRCGVSGGGYAVVAFLVCAVVSTSTGTSFGAILLCGPLLYPAGGSLGADPAYLVGAILGGATFGDNVSPVSDTTIASASTQGVEVGRVVRSRLRYAIPAALGALVLTGLMGRADVAAPTAPAAGAGPVGLWMLAAPAVTIALLVAGRHLLEGLFAGVASAVAVGLLGGSLAPTDLVSIDAERFAAGGLLLSGMERGVGASIFTILLMGLVGGIEATGVVARVAEAAARRSRSVRVGEAWLVAGVSAAVFLTTHSVVAILIVGRPARQAGEALGIDGCRRANLLDTTVCTWPFLLPFFIPTILAASITASGADFGMPRVSAAVAGLHNLHSWALLVMVVLAVATGYGRAVAGDARD